MTEHLTIEEYRSLPDVFFPMIIEGKEDSMTIQQLTTSCDECDQEVHSLRIKTLEIVKGCIELKMGGYCSSCGVYQSGKMRYYIKQHRIMEFSEIGISERKLHPLTRMDSVKANFGRLTESVNNLRTRIC